MPIFHPLKKWLIGTACLITLASAGLAGSAHAAAVQPISSVQIAAAQKTDKLVAFAESLRGKVHYQFGVNNPSTYTFDCSSFTKYVFASQGISLKWGTAYQSKEGTYVAKKNLKKGDLIFFSVSTPGKINHVGIYIGNGKFIHNTIGRSVNGVIISDLNSVTYTKRYITARRAL